MKGLRAHGRLRAFWRIVRGQPEAFVHRNDPARIRAEQRAAAREAFLSKLSPGQRVLAGPDYGDTQ